MDYEQLYKEALQRAKKIKLSLINEDVEYNINLIFPELKENEDESIRKGLIQYLENDWNYNPSSQSPTFYKDAIAWLEKQKELVESEPYYIEERGVDVYEPFKTTIGSILKMCDSYEQNGDFSDARAVDFLSNVRVKCKDAIRYEEAERAKYLTATAIEGAKPYYIEGRGIFIPVINKVLDMKDLVNYTISWAEARRLAQTNGKDLPSKREFYVINYFIYAINKLLSEHGGEPLNNTYWSRSEFDGFCGWSADLTTNKINACNKLSNYHVRAISNF